MGRLLLFCAAGEIEKWGDATSHLKTKVSQVSSFIAELVDHRKILTLYFTRGGEEVIQGGTDAF